MLTLGNYSAVSLFFEQSRLVAHTISVLRRRFLSKCIPTEWKKGRERWRYDGLYFLLFSQLPPYVTFLQGSSIKRVMVTVGSESWAS